MSEVVIPYCPRPQFIPYHRREQRFACIVAHRRFGKTTGCINDGQQRGLSLKLPQPRVAYIAPLLRQAKDAAWDKLKLIATPLLQYGAKINESELRVDYPNGARFRLYGADNPDSLRGIYLDDVILDEYAQMDPMLWEEVIRPALADRQGRATFIGTPKGRDAFWKVHRLALENKSGDWFHKILRASETGVLLQSELDAMKAEMGEAQYARELECSFDEPDEAQLISANIVMAARNREGFLGKPRILGVDVARAGADHNVILLRCGDKVPDDGIERYRAPDLMQTVGRVANAIERFKPDAVFVDGGGVGGGVVDRLRQLGYQVIEVNAGSSPSNGSRYKNLRAEMWDKTKEWLKSRGSIPHDEPLIDDLTAPNYKFDISNRLQIESKDDMKSRGVPSPDTGDALAMTFAHPVAAPELRGASRWHTAEPMTDPFA